MEYFSFRLYLYPNKTKTLALTIELSDIVVESDSDSTEANLSLNSSIKTSEKRGWTFFLDDRENGVCHSTIFGCAAANCALPLNLKSGCQKFIGIWKKGCNVYHGLLHAFMYLYMSL